MIESSMVKDCFVISLEKSLRVWFSSYSSLIGSIMSSSGVIVPKKCSAKSPCNWSEVLMLPYGNLRYQSCACYSNVNGNTPHHCSGVKPCFLVISLNRSICIKGNSFWNIWGLKLIPWYCWAHDFCWEQDSLSIIILQLNALSILYFFNNSC